MTDTGILSAKARLALRLRRKIGSEFEDVDFDTIMRHKTYQIVAFSMAGVLSMAALAWTTYSRQLARGVTMDVYFDDPNAELWVINFMYLLQIITSGTTFVTIVLIWQKYDLLVMLKQAEWNGVCVMDVERSRHANVRSAEARRSFSASYTFVGSNLFWGCVLECFLHLVHPVIFIASVRAVPTTYAVANFPPNVAYKALQLFMFVRLYLIRDVIHLVSAVHRRRFEVVNADPNLKKTAYRIERILTLKIFFYTFPVVSFLFAAVMGLVAFGFGLFSMESTEVNGNNAIVPQTSNFNPTNSLWCAFVTFRTIGFGDYYPVTVPGRIVAALCVLAGMITLTVFVAVLVAKVPLSKEQLLAVEYLRTKQADEKCRDAAALLIKTSIMVYLYAKLEVPEGKKNVPVVHHHGHKGNRLYFAIKRFRVFRSEVNGSFTQAHDVVISQKLEAVATLAKTIQRETSELTAQFDALQDEISAKLRAILSDASRFKQRGYAAT